MSAPYQHRISNILRAKPASSVPEASDKTDGDVIFDLQVESINTLPATWGHALSMTWHWVDGVQLRDLSVVDVYSAEKAYAFE